MLVEPITVATGRPRSGRRTSRLSQPAYLHRWPGLSVPQAGGQRKVRAASEEGKSEPSSEAECFLHFPRIHVFQQKPRPPIPVRLATNEFKMYMRYRPNPQPRIAASAKGNAGCVNHASSQSLGAPPFITVSQTPHVSASTASRPGQFRSAL